MSNLEGLATSSTSIIVGNADNTQYLSVDSASLNTSPSASTFLPDQNSSTCLLLPNSPSPDPELTHPLTPGLEDPCEPADNGADDADTNSSSGSSGGINMVVMIDTEPNDETDDVFINNRKGNSNSQSQRSSPGFDENKQVRKIGDIIITCTDQIPPFVNWNWPLIRKWSFSLFICINIGVIGFVIAMMSTLPKTCNQTSKWYPGNETTTAVEISQNYSIEAETLPLVQDPLYLVQDMVNKSQAAAVALEHNVPEAWFPVRKSKRKMKELRPEAIN